jgi:hypothetical protein
MRYRFYLIFFLSFYISSCSSDPLDVDVSDVELSMKFERFEQKMFSAQSVSEMSKINQQLIDSGGELYEFYVYEMLHSGSVYDDSIGTYLYYFVTDSIMKMAQEDITAEFRNFEEDEELILDAFKHLKYHLPAAAIPQKVITYNSAFNYGVISTNDQIGIGLDMYLGSYNRIIENLGFPLYMKEKMEHEYLLIDIAHSWIITNILDDPGESFLANMIYYGKLMYLIDAMLPNQADYLKLRYTEEEYDFALASEEDVWLFIMDMNWVYSTDMKVQIRYFQEAPSTVGIDGSPGRLGQFMGWQMVKQYMEKNEDKTVIDMLDEKNEAKFLKIYKPDNE